MAEWQNPDLQGGMNISSLLQFLPGIISSFRGIDTGRQKQISDQLNNIGNAAYNPSNPLYQQLYGQNRNLMQQNLGQAISQLEGENRKLANMGRSPLFSPERGGEMAFRQVTAMAPQIGLQAQDQTQKQLLNAANILGNRSAGALGAANNYTQLQYGPRAETGAANQSLAGFGSLANFLRAMSY